jgi:hypothetical protein
MQLFAEYLSVSKEIIVRVAQQSCMKSVTYEWDGQTGMTNVHSIMSLMFKQSVVLGELLGGTK